jgi:DNA polymerase-1
LVGLENVNITFVETAEQVLAFLHWLGLRRDVLAVDTETSGLVWTHDKLRLVQVGDHENAWCFDAQDWMGLLRDVLPRYTGEFVFHNAKFDVHFLEHRGRVKWTSDMWRRTHDTAVLAHLHQPDRGRALKSLTRTYIDPRAATAQQVLDMAMEKQKWGWGDIPVNFPYYWAYGGLDAVLTARLFTTLPRDRISDELYDVERKTLYATYKMETKGACIDVKFAIEKKNALDVFVQETKEWVKAYWGVDSIGSNLQLTRKFQELGFELTKLTESGLNFAMDEEVLSLIDHPLAAAVLAARKAEKMANTYLRNFIEMNIDGLVHCDMNTLGARTGRMSISRPALQTLTRGKGPVRDSFISRYGEEDGRLVLVDYDQLEMRQLAVLSQDTNLVTAFFQPDDFFTTMTRAIYRDPTIGKTDPRRQRTKNARYARNYGAGLPKIALTNGIPLEEVELIEGGWSRQYPVAAEFPRAVENIARHRKQTEGEAYVMTPTLRRYEPAKKGEYYQLVNYLTQGFAADVFKEAIVRCDEAGLDEFFVLPIHDEGMFDVPVDMAEEVAQVAQKVMRDDRYAVPFTTGYDIVARWGDKYL